MRSLWLIVLLLMSPQASWAQSWLAQPGAVGTKIVDMGTSRVRLPPGEWQSIGEAKYVYKDQNIPMIERIFLQTDGKRVIAMAYLKANESGNTFRKGFTVSPSCYRQDAFMNESHDLYRGEWDCMIVNHSMMQLEANAGPMWTTAAAAAKPLGGLPAPAPYAEFARASPSHRDFLIVRIYVNPEAANRKSDPLRTWSNSEWNKTNIAPDRASYLNKLATWSVSYRQVLSKSWD
jgi:hypothetical protein